MPEPMSFWRMPESRETAWIPDQVRHDKCFVFHCPFNMFEKYRWLSNCNIFILSDFTKSDLVSMSLCREFSLTFLIAWLGVSRFIGLNDSIG
jgi:hypothetical protein